MSQSSAISCHNLSKSFGHVTAVDSVSLDVPVGSFTALLGPSGCGKTTVLRLLAGLEHPDFGTIQAGSRILASPDQWLSPEARQIGMVFQEYALFPHLDVRRNVAFGLRGRPDVAERVANTLRLVRLEDLADRSPHALSGGQQQRVALARALAPEPEIILLDEPFSNLDAALRQQVRDEVRDILRRAGVTAIFVTHDQEEALSLADRIAVMIDGRLLQSATPRELYDTPATRTVATFLGAANFLPGTASGNVAECELGSIPLRQSATGPVELMIRPENISLASIGNGNATVQHHEYLGHSTILHLRLDSGAPLTIRLPAPTIIPTINTRLTATTTTPAMPYPPSSA